MGKGFFHIKDFLSADSNKQGKRGVDPVPAGQVTHAWATGMEENKTAYEHKKLFVGRTSSYLSSLQGWPRAGARAEHRHGVAK